jgi:FlaA1/EpsC-like NDP-sugar epimerase
MISLEDAVKTVWMAFDDMIGGEIYVKKIPSMKVIDIARVVAPGASQKIIGIRPGEKLHEQMIGVEDARSTFEYDQYYKILPQINEWFSDPVRIKDGKKVPEDFVYSSDSNSDWMSEELLEHWICANNERMELSNPVLHLRNQ